MGTSSPKPCGTMRVRSQGSTGSFRPGQLGSRTVTLFGGSAMSRQGLARRHRDKSEPAFGVGQEEQPQSEPEKEDLLGLSIAPLTDELRNQYGIGKSIEGVVITEVKPDSPAAQKNVKPGDVIVEVTQEKVKEPQDVKARLLAVRKSGRKQILFLLSDAKGELRFVAVPTS